MAAAWPCRASGLARHTRQAAPWGAAAACCPSACPAAAATTCPGHGPPASPRPVDGPRWMSRGIHPSSGSGAWTPDCATAEQRARPEPKPHTLRLRHTSVMLPYDHRCESRLLQGAADSVELRAILRCGRLAAAGTPTAHHTHTHTHTAAEFFLFSFFFFSFFTLSDGAPVLSSTR